jgi:hypothetical protein
MSLILHELKQLNDLLVDAKGNRRASIEGAIIALAWAHEDARTQPSIVYRVPAEPEEEPRPEAAKDPLDHDGNGKKGGSLPKKARR